MIELNNVSKFYAGKPALDSVSLQLRQGEILALLGENGAGKTTLMKCILGFLPYRGTITLDGAPVTPANIARISFATCEHSFFPGLSPRGHGEFYAAHFPHFSHKRFAGLMDFFSLPMNRPLRSFSTGQQNQFEVIMALCQGADYILMDEPFAGNDIFNREDFYKVLLGILEPNETVVLSTHLIEEVSPFLSRAVLLRQGKIAGDVRLADLEEEGQDLISYIKQTYRYRPDRVSRALDDLTGEGDGP